MALSRLHGIVFSWASMGVPRFHGGIKHHLTNNGLTICPRSDDSGLEGIPGLRDQAAAPSVRLAICAAFAAASISAKVSRSAP